MGPAATEEAREQCREVPVDAIERRGRQVIAERYGNGAGDKTTPDG